MLSVAPFWLAGAAIIVLMSLWARANRRSGWRRERPEAEAASLQELLALSAELQRRSEQIPEPVKLRADPRARADVSDSASLIALQAALSRAGTPQPALLREPQTVTRPAPTP